MERRRRRSDVQCWSGSRGLRSYTTTITSGAWWHCARRARGSTRTRTRVRGETIRSRERLRRQADTQLHARTVGGRPRVGSGDGGGGRPPVEAQQAERRETSTPAGGTDGGAEGAHHAVCGGHARGETAPTPAVSMAQRSEIRVAEGSVALSGEHWAGGGQRPHADAAGGVRLTRRLDLGAGAVRVDAGAPRSIFVQTLSCRGGPLHACSHAEPLPDSGALQRDVGSLNGTVLNGNLASRPNRQPGPTLRIAHGDIVRLGERTDAVRLRVDLLYPPAPPPPPPHRSSTERERAPLPAVEADSTTRDGAFRGSLSHRLSH